MPPAPPLFSMMTCWPSSSVSGGAKIRPTTSIGPPAGNGTTMVMGRLGQSCALAGPAQASATMNAVIPRMFLLPRSPRLCLSLGRRFSIRARPAGLDRARPAIDFARDELRQILRSAALRCRDRDADALEPLAHGRCLHRLVRGLGEALHDLGGRALGKRERAPAAAIEAGEAELLGGRQLLEPGRAVEPERGDRLHRVRLDLR